MSRRDADSSSARRRPATASADWAIEEPAPLNASEGVFGDYELRPLVEDAPFRIESAMDAFVVAFYWERIAGIGDS